LGVAAQEAHGIRTSGDRREVAALQGFEVGGLDAEIVRNLRQRRATSLACLGKLPTEIARRAVALVLSLWRKLGACLQHGISMMPAARLTGVGSMDPLDSKR
jgi:hypothetical protein